MSKDKTTSYQLGVTCIIENEQKEWAMTLRSENCRSMHNQWACPGGGVDPGETLLETAIREAKEEIGLDIQIVNLIGMQFEHCNFGDWINFIFHCSRIDPKQELKNCEPHKFHRVEWVDINNPPGPTCHILPSIIEKFKEYKTIDITFVDKI